MSRDASFGDVYIRKAHFDKALVQYRRALDIQIRVFGQEHPDVADLYNNIGLVYHSQGKVKEALDQLHRAFEIRI